ncbi:putative transcriptional regulator [Prosthecobacter fusiformis]|uniref:Putative transcriptional regulator n=2 Tax=Prosthecobacter fusiformis TaxID=48464 RepID=A0A4R7SS33_9BACT|nr:putative transcriptional regulator [Prosthecobacter fusiformis]
MQKCNVGPTYAVCTFIMPTTPDASPLAGNLLLAVPSMRDPNFKRTVIFVAAHNQEDGAFGYVLNRPLDQRVADLLPDQDLGALGQVPVYIGGPVATDKLAFASLHWNRKKSTLRCQTHLSVADAMHELSMGHEVRGFVGYSGWTGGQIEGEIQRKSWIIAPAPKVILTLEQPTTLWSAVLDEMGPIFQLMANTPERVDLS